jgi:hypothetical protein
MFFEVKRHARLVAKLHGRFFDRLAALSTDLALGTFLVFLVADGENLLAAHLTDGWILGVFAVAGM